MAHKPSSKYLFRGWSRYPMYACEERIRTPRLVAIWSVFHICTIAMMLIEVKQIFNTGAIQNSETVVFTRTRREKRT